MMDERLLEFLIRFTEYLNKEGYQVAEGEVVAFCRTAPYVMDSVGDKDGLETLLLPLMAKSKKQVAEFHFHFSNFLRCMNNPTKDEIKEAKEKMARMGMAEKRLEREKKALSQAKKNLEQTEKKAGKKFPDSKKKNIDKCKKSMGNDLGKLLKKSPREKTSELLMNPSVDCQKKDLENAVKDIPSMMPMCMGLKNPEDGMIFLSLMSDLFQGLLKEKMRQSEIDLKQRQLKAQERKTDEARKSLESLAAPHEIEKWKSVIHRDEFLKSEKNNFVSALNPESKDFLDTPFKKLSSEDVRCIHDYLTENMKSFRTRFAKNIRSHEKKRLDLSETVKRACGTSGIPLKLYHIKPRQNRARLVMFLDISGSCREASEFMLCWMHCMKDLFPGGCRCYAFVNQLYDISGIFETHDVNGAIAEVFRSIQTKGVYSDYGTPFSHFHQEKMSDLSRDSMVFIVGDARGNKRDPGIDAMKAIGRRVRSCYWMNTESMDRWDTGDSDVGKYAPFLTRMFQTTTMGELIDALKEVR